MIAPECIAKYAYTDNDNNCATLVVKYVYSNCYAVNKKLLSLKIHLFHMRLSN